MGCPSISINTYRKPTVGGRTNLARFRSQHSRLWVRLFKSLAQYWNHKATAVLYQLRPSSSGVKSNQQSILNYHSVFQQTVNSQLSTVNNNSGATGIDMKSPESLKFQPERKVSFPHPVYFV